MLPSEPAPEYPEDFQSVRARLRREKLLAREQMAARGGLHAECSARIASHLAALLQPRTPASIGFCAPVRGEFDARPLIGQLLAEGWSAAMPVVLRAHAPMGFRQWTPDARMSRDRHGIPIPETAEAALPQILLLPLVAFDAAGYRLGYGGGYFDRTLAACVPRPLAIGVGFEAGRVSSVVAQPHDQRCDIIVTESGIARISACAGA